MDKGKLLSPEEALKVTKATDTQLLLEKFLSYKDDATFLGLHHDEERRRYIDEKVEEQVDLFGVLSVKPADSLGTVEWLDERHESMIVQFANRPQFMGRKENGQIYLNNEETLFLIEKGSVICHHKQLQLSLQDAFDLMLSDPIEFERYQVYAHLLRLGYRVKRCELDGGEKPKVNLKEREDNQGIADNQMIIDKPATMDKQTTTNAEAYEEMQVDSQQTDGCKRPTEQDQQQAKRTKPTGQPIHVNFVPLDQLMLDLHRFRIGNDESDFLKFTRFRKLTKTGLKEDWSELESEYSRSQSGCANSYQSMRSFVIDSVSLEQLMNDRSSLEAGPDEHLEAFRRDFLSDSPLIELGERLTDEQIRQRLASYGPQLDSSDSEETFWDDLAKATDQMNVDAVQKDNVESSLNTGNHVNNTEGNLNDTNRSAGRVPDSKRNRKESSADQRDSRLYDYDVYLPNKKQRIQGAAPDYYLKILHSSRHLKFPFAEIFRVNARVANRRKLLFVHCQSNELNFYQFTDVELANC